MEAHPALCNGIKAQEFWRCAHVACAANFKANGSRSAFSLAHLCYLCIGSVHLVPMQPMVNM